MRAGVQDPACFVLPRPCRASLSVGERSRGFPSFSSNSKDLKFGESRAAAAQRTVRCGLAFSCSVVALNSILELQITESMNLMNCFVSRSFRTALLSALVLGPLMFVAEAQGPTGSNQTPFTNTNCEFKGGTVTIDDVRTCIDCVCAYSGSPTVTETFAFFGCSATSASTLITACPPTAGCPDGVKGVGTTYKVECCDIFLELGFFCFSYTVNPRLWLVTRGW